MNTYKANVLVGAVPGKSSGRTVQAQVQARNVFDAKVMLQAQYGKANVSSVVVLVKQ